MFLVLEYCEGGELQDLFKEKGHFAEDVSNSFVRSFVHLFILSIN